MAAAATQPQLTCQDFDGRFRSPMAFAVRTPPVSTTACSRWATSTNWGCWLPGTPGIPSSGMLVQVMEYFQPAGEYHPVGPPPEAKPVARRCSGATLRFTNNRTVARAYRLWACCGAPSQ